MRFSTLCSVEGGPFKARSWPHRSEGRWRRPFLLELPNLLRRFRCLWGNELQDLRDLQDLQDFEDLRRVCQPRCCDHQVRQAAGSAAMEAPVMSRKAWNTQPPVVASSVLSSIICKRSGTARSRCCRFSMPDCANPQPPRSRTSAEGSLRNASSSGSTVSSVPSMDNPSTAQYRVCSSGSCPWSISVVSARCVSTPRVPSNPSIHSAHGRAEGSFWMRTISVLTLSARFGKLY